MPIVISGNTRIGWERTWLPVTVDNTSTIVSAAGQWFGRATVKRLSSSVLVLCYREGPSHGPDSTGEIHIRFSDDDGLTWSKEDKYLSNKPIAGFPMNPNPRTGDQEGFEPWLCLAPNADLILHMWRFGDSPTDMDGTYQSISSDGGLIWGATTAIDFGGIANDAHSFSTDDDFVYDGVIYAGVRTYQNNDQSGWSRSQLIKSTDNGVTWEKVSTICDEGDISNGAIEVGLEYLDNNTIIAMIRDNMGAEGTYKRYSYDMGVTWGPLQNVTYPLAISGRHRVYTRAHLKGEADWWEDPVLIMCGFVNPFYKNAHPRRNAIWVSLDRGVSWSVPNYVDIETNDAGYGDLFYDSSNDQYVLVSYQGTTAEAVLKQYNVSIAGI